MEFKVGDRVRVYGDFIRAIICTTQGFRATVTNMTPSGRIAVQFDDSDVDGNTINEMVYPQQCRRLKPKAKPREFWLNSYGDDSKPSVHRSFESANKMKVSGLVECIHVREVKS